MAVDKTAGRYDGLIVIAAIHVDHADGSAVQSDDIGAIGRHLRSPAAAAKMSMRVYEFEKNREETL